MRLWAKTDSLKEGKFLVVRRDGTIPEWPHFVLGARDPASPIALRAYADAAEKLGYDPAFVADIRTVADDFDRYRAEQGEGDADAAPHRVDIPAVLCAMRGESATIHVSLGANKKKAKPLHVYYFDDEGWVVAESPEDAAKVYADAGFEMAEECDGEWEKRPDDKMLTMHDSAPDGGDETKTCAEWAAGGRRYLGGANY